VGEEPTLRDEGIEGPVPEVPAAPGAPPRRRLWSVARILGAIGFVLVVLGWFPLYDYTLLQDMELWLPPGERREVDVAAGSRVVVSGWFYPGWPAESEDYGGISALDSTGTEVAGVHGGYGPYSFDGGIERLVIRSGDAPARVTLRVLDGEAADRVLRSERILQALSALLLIPFLSVLLGALSPWTARDRSSPRLRRRAGWAGVAAVGALILALIVDAVISGIEGHYRVAPIVQPLGFLSWSASLLAGVAIVIALASLERRAIGGRLLEMRASPVAVLCAAFAVFAGWCFWRLTAGLAPDSWAGPWRIDSTGAFPAAVLLALSAGISEEIVFRGFLLTRLRELTGSTVLPLLATSAAFGLAHLYVSGLDALQAGMLGLVLGMVTLGSRNLFPAILAHAGWDLLWTVSLTFDAVRGLA
jgi:membrane protease YdiL (CAAX protease family)